MKFKIVHLVFMLYSTLLVAQVTNEGIPKSWELNLETDKVSTVILPSFDIDQIRAEDLINDNNFDAPWRFGYTHSVDYGIEDGSWTVLENGDRVWRLLISSEGALSLNFIFDDFSAYPPPVVRPFQFFPNLTFTNQIRIRTHLVL